MSDQCKITLLFLFIIVFPLTSHAQNFEKIDSLKSELEKTNNDSLKIELNDQLFRNYYQYDPEIAKGYYESILDLAGNTNNVNGMYKGYFAGAIYYTMLSQFDSALFYFNEAHKYAEVLNNEELRIESLLAISHTHLWKNEMELAKKVGFRSLKLSEEIHDSTSMALSYKNLGEIYSLENHLDSATSFYLKAINILEDSGKERSKLGDLYTGIGEIYINLNELEKAEEFLDKSIELFEKIQDTDGVMFASAMKGGMYFSKDNYEAAIEILHPVLKYYESVGDPYRISETNRYLGLSYLNRDNRSEAKKYLSEAVIKGREANEPINLAEALMAYGNLHLMRKAYQDAHKLFIEAEDLYSEVGFLKGKIKSTEMLSSLYEKMGDHAKSNTRLKELMNLKDSLNEIENASVVQELEARYQNEKKQHQIDLLENENRLNELERSRQRKIFIVSIIVALVIIFLLYFLYKTNQKANKKLKELDAFKSRFFANISHEFRTPLTLISGPVENRLKQPGLSQQERTELELVHRNSKQLLDLVDQLLDLSKIESGGFKLNVGSGDLTNLMKTLVSSFEYAAGQKNIDFKFTISEPSDEIWFDKDAMQKIVTNLLSNAIKYTPENGSVNFSVGYEDKNVTITCANTGTQISKENIDKVFDRFYQQNGKAGGVGIGLALIKELTDLLNGTVWVDSTREGYTTFQVILPIDKTSFKSEDLLSDKNQSVYVPLPDIAKHKFNEYSTDQQDDDTPLLLIIEDNLEVRKFIRGILKDEYRIVEADNGSKGIESALEHIPDLVISDIMMPEVDGVELCQTLKTDEKTSHIPIILLTAKAGEESKLEGYEMGADDYIVKPFSSEILKIRIEKLIEIRRNLQRRFSQEIVLKPKEISITPADEKFLNKVQQILDAHLSNSGFTAEFFSKEIGMSRMQLHRKLKALTGLSTNHFIRLQRLKLAADLLSSSNINVSEVGYEVGFNDPSYFAKCFKEYHGRTPSEYAKETAKNEK